jgi:hypothetical protein
LRAPELYSTDGIVSSISDSEDIDIRILDHDDNPEVTAPRQFKSIVSRKRYPITIRAPEPAADRCRIAEGLPEAYHWLERHPEDLSCGA